MTLARGSDPSGVFFVLMNLMASVKQQAPSGLLNADVLLCDQFVENVIDGFLSP